MRKLLALVGACLAVLVATWVWSWVAGARELDVTPRVDLPSQAAATPIALEEPEPAAVREEQRDEVAVADVPHIEFEQRGAKFDDSESATLLIQVRDDSTGAPIQDVRILLWPEPRGKAFFVVNGTTASERFGRSPLSDEQGRCRIQVPADRTFQLETQSRSAAPVTLEIPPLAVGEERQVEVRLTRGAVVHFVARVVDDETGAPLADAHARVGTFDEVRSDPDAGGKEAGADAGRTSVAVDSGGYLEVDLDSLVQQVLRVDAPDHAWTLVARSPGHETRDTALEIRLRRAAVVEAQIVARGPVGIEGLQVELTTDYYQLVEISSMDFFPFSTDPARWSARTDASGRARIEGVPPGVSLDVAARPPGEKAVKQPDSLSLRPGETRVIEIEIGGGASVTGWLRDVGGAAVDDAELWLMARSEVGGGCPRSHERDSAEVVHTDAQGRFRFEGVPDGTWLVGCAPDGPFAPETSVVFVAQGRADREPILTADASLFIRGRVLGPDDRPIEASLFAVGGESGCFMDGETASDGTFSLGPLVRGRYAVSAISGGGQGEAMSKSEALQVDAGASDVTLVLRHGGAISGRVVDPVTGSGVKADIAAVLCDTAEGGMWMLATSQDGSFRVDGLEAGTYAVSARTAGLQVGYRIGIQVAAGGEVADVLLSVEPGARLRIRYDGEAEFCSLRVLHGEVPLLGDGLQRGNDTTFVVPAGSLTVECREYSGGTMSSSRSKSVEVAVGALAALEFVND